MHRFALLETGLFDTITGLPVHPLVVHAVVVLLPLSALVLIAIVLRPAWRRPYGWPTIAGLAVGTAAAFAAKESGEALAAHVGLPAAHARWGDILPWEALALLVVASVWFLLQRRAGAARSGLVLGTGIAAIVLAVASLVLTVVVGHSGATAVWEDQLTPAAAGTDGPSEGEPTAAPSPTASATPTTSAVPAATPSATVQSYSLDDVKQHAAASSCWSAIDGNVYDLTKWVARHPGGSARILSLCGKDGTATFHDEHGTETTPNKTLGTFKIGVLS